MKKYLLIFSLLFITFVSANAQMMFIKATHGATRISNTNGLTWEDWSEWQECDIDITIDLEKMLLCIDSKEPQLYKLSEYANLDNEENIKIESVDLDGIKCSVYILKWEDNRKTLEIRYANFMIAYNIIFKK